MRITKLVLGVILSTAPLMAQTTGAPLNLNLPDVHSQNWNVPLNANFTTINTSYSLLAPKSSPTFTGTVTLNNIVINGSCTGAGCGGGSVSSVFGRTGSVVAAANDYSFSQLSGTADLASQVFNILPVANGGTGTSTPGLIEGTNITITGTWPNQTITASATAATAFSALTSATNTVAAMLCGTGCSMGTSGGGTIAATSAPFTGLSGNLGLTQGPSSLSGILKDTAGTLSVAAAGTDYLLPTGSAAGLSKASSAAFGVSECDNTTITCSGGIFTAIGGAVSSVFGRTGAVIAVSGDYTVGQVTGAAPLASPTFTGTPLSTTAAVNNNTTQIATTAFVLAQAANVAPLIDGTATIGTSLRFARMDHIHPTDTTRAPLASPTFTGVPSGPTASLGTNTTQLATTAFVIANAVGVAGLTTGFFPKAATSTTLTNSLCDEGITTANVFTCGDTAGAKFIGQISIASASGVGGGDVSVEGSAPSGVSLSDVNWADLTNHRPMFNPNAAGALLYVGIGSAGTSGHIVKLATNGIDLIDGGAAPTGTVSSIVFSGPLSGGTVTTTGTVGCPTCVTSAAALSSNGVMIGGGLQASSTIAADTTVTHFLAATAGAPAFRAIALTDLPTQSGTGSICMTTGCAAAGTNFTAIPTAALNNNAVTSAKMAIVNTYKTCDIPINDTSASAITTGQMGPQSRVCYIPSAATIVEMDVNADAGTPNIIVGRNHAGTITNIVSAALGTAASGGIACSKTTAVTGLNTVTTCSATLQNTSLAAGDYLELVSGTPGGTAKFFVVHVIYTVN